MIKDRAQKGMAARFCAAQGVVPYLEVVVRSSAALEDMPVDVTDVDVLGIEFGRRGLERRILFDCKTGKMSAINRALWAAGLKSYVKASEAFLILKKDAPYSHRLVANELGVHVHSEANFEKYAVSVSPNYLFGATYLANMDLWDYIPEISAKYGALSEIASLSNTYAAMESNGARGLRSLLGIFIKSAQELDPRKTEHLFVYANFLSAFSGFMTLAVVDLKNIFQFDMGQDDFEKTLRYYIWGGKDSYMMRRNLRLSIERAGAGGANVEVELPEWKRFVGIVRSFLDAPDALAQIPYLSKEIAFRCIEETPREEADRRLSDLFKLNNRARQFLFLLNAYLVAAGAMPKEFKERYEEAVNASVSSSSTNHPGS